MSATVSMYFRQLLLASTFAPEFAIPLEQVYVALTYEVAPADAVGEQLLEPNTGGYARAMYRIGTGAWLPTGFSEIYNAERIDFPTATDDWGVLLGWALMDSPTSGMSLAVGSLVEPAEILEGMNPSIDLGILVVGLYD